MKDWTATVGSEIVLSVVELAAIGVEKVVTALLVAGFHCTRYASKLCARVSAPVVVNRKVTLCSSSTLLKVWVRAAWSRP